jgi:hypothetical protein
VDDAGIKQLIADTRVAVARAWSAAIARLRAENGVETIALRLHTLDPVLGLQETIGAFARAERDAYLFGARRTMRWIGAEAGKVSKSPLEFDADAQSEAWAIANTFERIRGLDTEQRALVSQIIRRGTVSSANPKVIAREIRDAIGLTPAQERIVSNYRVQLESGDLASALQRELSSGASDRAIVAALRSRSSLRPAQIDLAVDRYRQNFIALRAETIARTESQRIAHQAGNNAFDQAIRRQVIAADQAVCEWLHSPRALDQRHAREFHRSMHGQTRAWGEPFESGLGNLLMFPGDPEAPQVETLNCRCARTVRIRPRAVSAAAA